MSWAALTIPKLREWHLLVVCVKGRIIWHLFAVWTFQWFEIQTEFGMHRDIVTFRFLQLQDWHQISVAHDCYCLCWISRWFIWVVSFHRLVFGFSVTVAGLHVALGILSGCHFGCHTIGEVCYVTRRHDKFWVWSLRFFLVAVLSCHAIRDMHLITSGKRQQLWQVHQLGGWQFSDILWHSSGRVFWFTTNFFAETWSISWRHVILSRYFVSWRLSFNRIHTFADDGLQIPLFQL